MGRKTWQQIPMKDKPLTNRLNVIITSDPEEFNQYCIDGDITNHKDH